MYSTRYSMHCTAPDTKLCLHKLPHVLYNTLFQVCKLQSELLRKATQFSCSCPPAPTSCPPAPASRPQAPQRPPRAAGGQNRQVQGRGQQGTGQHLEARPRANCLACAQHLCQAQGASVRWEQKLEPSGVHLCEHVRCLQRQVCHLKLQLGQARSKGKPEAEVVRLEDKVDSLLDQKKQLLERVSELQRRLEGLQGPNPKVREVIEGIERQRDTYKKHVEKLIKELQGGGKARVTVVDEVARELDKEKETRREQSGERGRQEGEERERRSIPSRHRGVEAQQLPPPVPPHRGEEGRREQEEGTREQEEDRRELEERRREVDRKVEEEVKKREAVERRVEEEVRRREEVERRREGEVTRTEEEVRRREEVERTLAEVRSEASVLRRELGDYSLYSAFAV